MAEMKDFYDNLEDEDDDDGMVFGSILAQKQSAVSSSDHGSPSRSRRMLRPTPPEEQDKNEIETGDAGEFEDLLHPLIPDASNNRTSSSDQESKTLKSSWDELHYYYSSNAQMEMAQGQQHRRVPSNIKISMRQVLQHSPCEDDVDTYIQQALDEMDGSQAAPQGRTTTILLQHVPLDVPLQTFRSEDTRSTTTPSPPPLPLYKHRKRASTLTTAENLYLLSHSMKQFQIVGGRDSSMAASGSATDDDSSLNKNPFLQHASVIMKNEINSFRRKRAGAGAGGVDSTEMDQDPTRNATSSSMVSKQESGGSKSDRVGRNGSTEKVETIFEEANGEWSHDIEMMDQTNTPPALPHVLNQSTSTKQGEEESKQGDSSSPAKVEPKSTTSVIEGGDGDMEGGDNIPVDDSTPSRFFRNPLQVTMNRAILAEYKNFEDWLRYQRSSAWTHIRVVLFLLMLPATGIAALLFYVFDNPPCSHVVCTGTPSSLSISTTTTTPSSFQTKFFGVGFEASVSWWLLFIFCRQAVTFTLGRGTNAILVYYFGLKRHYLVRIAGPFVTLFIVQARGWPTVIFFWGFYNFILLYGNNIFAKHWLFYQQAIGLFNDTNPSGNITASNTYLILLLLTIGIPLAEAIKRFFFGIHQGQKTFIRYSEELARIMRHALMISQVAKLSRTIETSKLRFENFDFKVATYDSSELEGTNKSKRSSSPPPESNGMRILSGFDTAAKKARLNELLGAWEALEAKNDPNDNPNIAEILQFRQSLSYLDSPFPFGLAFGPSSTREECVESAEAVYNRLLQSVPGRDVLIFDVVAMLSISDDGELDDEMLGNLIKLFRPDREGFLTVLDFAKSVDTVYKEMRLLRANVANSSKLDTAFENMLSVLLYFVLVLVVIAACGVNPFTIFTSVSAFLLSFSILHGLACSKFFEGLLLILIQRPFDIGDRISVSLPNTETKPTGSRGWVVQDIGLFASTIMFGPSCEVATVANGSLSTARIINAARSHKAQMKFLFKFPIETPYVKIKMFKSSIERFIKARPREWGALVSCRCIRVEADLGFVEYTILARHREAWQANGAIKQSRGDLSMFAVELTKKMGIQYESPSLPINLTVKRGEIHAVAVDESVNRSQGNDDSSTGDVAREVAALFDTEL